MYSQITPIIFGDHACVCVSNKVKNTSDFEFNLLISPINSTFFFSRESPYYHFSLSIIAVDKIHMS